MIIFEISADYVKAVWGKNNIPLKDSQINGMVCKPLGVSEPDEVIEVISSIINESIYKKYKPLILCMPRDQVILRNLSFPSKDEVELESIIELHLTQEVPYSREEIIYNYSTLDKTQDGFTNVLLSIVHRRTLLKQFSFFEKLNLYPDNILLGTFGLLRFFQKAAQPDKLSNNLIACLDIGDTFTDFFIAKGDKILFSKSIVIPGYKLKENDKLSKFVGELKQANMIARTKYNENPSKVYMSGIRWKNLELMTNISDIFQQEPVIIDPMEVISSLKGVDNAREITSKISISSLLGIALNPLSAQFSFVLPEAKMRKYARETAKHLFVTGGVVICLLVLMLIAFMGKTYALQNYFTRLSLEIRTMERMNETVMADLKKIKVLRKFARDQDSFLYFYYELARMVPRSIAVDRLVFNKKKEFSIVGKGADMGEVFKFVRTLNNSKMFGKAELRYSRKMTKGNEEFNEFNIMCHIG